VDTTGFSRVEFQFPPNSKLDWEVDTTGFSRVVPQLPPKDFLSSQQSAIILPK